MTEQIEVANGIKHLVPDELIGIAQTIAVKHSILIKHHGIIEAAALGQAVFTQPLDFLHKTEGTRPRNLLDVGTFGKIERSLLPAPGNGRMTEDN